MEEEETFYAIDDYGVSVTNGVRLVLVPGKVAIVTRDPDLVADLRGVDLARRAIAAALPDVMLSPQAGRLELVAAFQAIAEVWEPARNPTVAELVQVLNAMGIRSPQGGLWTQANLSQRMAAYGLTRKSISGSGNSVMPHGPEYYRREAERVLVEAGLRGQRAGDLPRPEMQKITGGDDPF